MVRIPAFHAGGPGSIPGVGAIVLEQISNWHPKQPHHVTDHLPTVEALLWVSNTSPATGVGSAGRRWGWCRAFVSGWRRRRQAELPGCRRSRSTAASTCSAPVTTAAALATAALVMVARQMDSASQTPGQNSPCNLNITITPSKAVRRHNYFVMHHVQPDVALH